MKYLLSFFLIISILNAFSQKEGYDYPILNKSDHHELIHNTKVVDEFRFLEESRSDITKQWLKEQTSLSNSHFNKSTLVNSINKRIEQRSYYQLNLEKKQGDYLFSFRFNYKNQAPSLYIRKSNQKFARLLINPSIFDEDPTIISNIVDFNLSQDQKFLAISISKAGTEWKEIRVINLDSKKLLKDQLKWIKLSSVTWSKNGFYYSRFETPPQGEENIALNQNSQIYFHQLNTIQEDDKLIYEQKNIPYGIFNVQSVNSNSLIIYGAELINDKYYQKIYHKKLNSINDTLIPIISDDYNSFYTYNIISEDDSTFLVSTNKYSLNIEVYKFFKNSSKKPIKFITNDYFISNVHVINDKIFITTHKNMQQQLFLYDNKGSELDRIYFPDGSSISNISANNNDSIIYFYLNSYISTPRLCKYNLNSYKLNIAKPSKLSYNEIKLVSETVQYSSADGTLIPMTIIRRADMKYNAEQATMIYGYGGFGVPIEPFYDPGFIFFIQNGGVIAIPAIRGGGENGEAWHQAGRTINKINAINDFAYAAKYLIKHRITNSNKIVARGSSNGALIISACINKYPDLFKSVVLEMGLYDMIRYHLFTTGYIASSEYGTSTNENEFKNLIKYSPLHNVNSSINYPSTYVITGKNDDRVPSLHSYKYVAKLQSIRQKNNIVLLEVLENAGHYGPQSYEDLLLNEAKIYTFIFNELGIKINIKN